MMQDKNNKNLILDTNRRNLKITIVLFAVFVIFTIAVSIIGVDAVGPNGSSVGFAKLNKSFADRHDYNSLWYAVTKILGVIAILICVFFAATGVLQLVAGKSLKKVSPKLWVLAAFYVAVIVFYLIFSVIVVNYRPILESDGTLEASYPSSHAMLAVCVFISAIIQIMGGKGSEKFKKIVCVVLGVFTVVMVIGRLLSGVHWLTDIIGGVILSAALLMAYYTALTSLYPKEEDY